MNKTTQRLMALFAGVTLMLTLVGCKPNTKSDDADELPHVTDVPKDTTQINVVKNGVDNTGKTDMTGLLTALHIKSAESGVPVYYPDGTYLFNGATLDLSGGVIFESQDGVCIRNSQSGRSIVQFDDAGNLIGLMQNHLELLCNQDEWVESGSLVSPPLSSADYETKVDLLAYWYNDFGLQSTAIANGRNGWLGNYDWRWNHSDCLSLGTEQKPYDPYNADLHPLLGYYRGDDPVVLDWICYWLQEYGVAQTAPFVGNGLDTKKWEDPACSYHWVYQLLNHTPNAKTMQFAFFLESGSYQSDVERLKTSWWQTFNTFYFNKEYQDMVYCYEKDGKRYPVVLIWDETALLYSWGETKPIVDLYVEVAEAFKAKGYGGVCVMAASQALSYNASEEEKLQLAEKGVMWFACDYPSNATDKVDSYSGRVDSFKALREDNRLYSVATGLHSHISHDSAWHCPGSSPFLFGEWLANVVEESQLAVETRPQIVTCYNVSEWTEGGPGLIPTLGNRFGYLEEVRDNIVITDETEEETDADETDDAA